MDSGSLGCLFPKQKLWERKRRWEQIEAATERPTVDKSKTTKEVGMREEGKF